MVDEPVLPASSIQTDTPISQLRKLRGSARGDWNTNTLSLDELEEFLHGLINCQMGEVGGRPIISTPIEPYTKAEELYLIVETKRFEDPQADQWLYLSDVANLLDQTKAFLVNNYAGTHTKTINDLVAHPEFKLTALQEIAIGGESLVSEQKAFDKRKTLLMRAQLLASVLVEIKEAQGEVSVFKSAHDDLVNYIKSHNLINAWAQVVLPVADAYQKTSVGSTFVALPAINDTQLEEGQYIAEEFPDFFDTYTELMAKLVEDQDEIRSKLKAELLEKLKAYKNQDFYFKKSATPYSEQIAESQKEIIRAFIEFFKEVIKYLIGDKAVEAAAEQQAAEEVENEGGEADTQPEESSSTSLDEAIALVQKELVENYFKQIDLVEIANHPHQQEIAKIVLRQLELELPEKLDLAQVIKEATIEVKPSDSGTTQVIPVFYPETNTINKQQLEQWLEATKSDLFQEFLSAITRDPDYLSQIISTSVVLVEAKYPSEQPGEVPPSDAIVPPQIAELIRQKNLAEVSDNIPLDQDWWQNLDSAQKFKIVSEVMGGSTEIIRFENVLTQFTLASSEFGQGLDYQSLPPELREQLNAIALAHLANLSFEDFSYLVSHQESRNSVYLRLLRQLQPQLSSLESLQTQLREYAQAQAAKTPIETEETKPTTPTDSEAPTETTTPTEVGTPVFEIPPGWSSEKKQLFSELQSAGVATIDVNTFEDTFDTLLLTNQDLSQIISSLSIDQAAELGIILSKEGKQAAQELVVVKDILTKYVEIRRREILQKVKPSLTKEQESIYQRLAEEFGFNQAEMNNLQNGVDTLVILSRDPTDFVENLDVEGARRYLGINFRPGDTDAQLTTLKSILQKYVQLRKQELVVDGFLTDQEELTGAFFLTRELIRTYGDSRLVSRAFGSSYGDQLDLDETDKLDQKQKQDYHAELQLRRAIVEELWRELQKEELDYYYELYPVDAMAMSAMAIPAGVSAGELMTTIDQRPEHLKQSLAVSGKQSLRQKLSNRFLKKKAKGQLKKRTINKALSKSAKKVGLDDAVAKATSYIPVVGAFSKTSILLSKLFGKDANKVMAALVAMSVGAFATAVHLATHSIGAAIGGLFGGVVGGITGGPLGALIGFTGGSIVGHQILPSSLSGIFGSSKAGAAGASLIPSATPALALGGLAATGYVATAIMSQSYLNDMPTIGDDPREISKYAEIEKRAIPGVRFDEPTDITYSIKMRAKPGYKLQVLEAPTDEATITFNEAENPNGETDLPESPTYGEFQTTLAGFPEAHPEISTEWVDVGTYILPFSSDEDGYNHANVRNTFSIKVRVIDDFGAEVEATENLSTSEVICFGNCPATREGCWPMTGRIGQLPYGIYTHSPSSLDQDAYDIMAPTGTPIYAPYAGTACVGSLDPRYGVHVTMQVRNFSKNGENGTLHLIFAHMDSIGDIPQGCVEISPAQVAGGFMIGYSGNTGNSSAPHLHYEARWNGLTVANKVTPSLIELVVPEPDIEQGQSVRSCHE